MSQDPANSEVVRTPDDEDLAAFAEGRLDGAMRDAVVARLAEDADYYELYAELLRFAEEEQLGSEGEIVPAVEQTERVIPFPAASTAAPKLDDSSASDGPVGEGPVGDGAAKDRQASGTILSWRRWAPAAGLAAAAALIAAIGFRILYQPPTLETLSAELKPSEGLLVYPPGGTKRGGSGDVPTGLDSDAAFRLGALLLDAVVVDRWPEGTENRDPRLDISILLQGSPWIESYWQDCQDQLTICAETFIAENSADPHALRFGVWARAVWLAARSNDVDYLSRAEVSRGARSLAWNAPDDETRGELRKIRAALTEGDVEALISRLERAAQRRRAGFEDLSALEP